MHGVKTNLAHCVHWMSSLMDLRPKLYYKDNSSGELVEAMPAQQLLSPDTR